MEPDISEFSYGFALTSELIERFKLKRAGAPEFATQHAESKKGGGWDMKLPRLPVFLQFKRAHEMVRATAAQSDLIGIPYFRIHLRRKSHSDQHQLMLDLEADGKTVLYAAPRFAKPIDLNQAFAANKVASRSIFVRPGFTIRTTRARKLTLGGFPICGSTATSRDRWFTRAHAF